MRRFQPAKANNLSRLKAAGRSDRCGGTALPHFRPYDPRFFAVSYQHIFGPVNSRRLGRSLGIDLVPRKVCSFNCVFCQVGCTTDLVLERAEYVPFDEVLSEFDGWLAEGGTADYATLAGSGEPTLHSRFGDVIKAVRDRCDARPVLLSNGSLFHLADVRGAACGADIVKGSLSAWDQASFERINRPHPDLSFDNVVSGVKALREEFGGELWLEVVAVGGVNDTADAMERIAALANGVKAERIHLNTVIHPPAEDTALAVPSERLREFAGLFEPAAEVLGARKDDEKEGSAGSRPVKGARPDP